MEEVVLNFFKAMVDTSRLRMAAMLLDEALSVEELAGRLHLRAADIPRHLDQFDRLGLLRQSGSRYKIDSKAMENLSRTVLANLRPTIEAHSNNPSAGEFERSVIKNYSLPNGQFKEIPLQEKKLQAILNHIVQVFEPGRRYTEKEVNEILKRFHPDSATLRRALVDRQMLEREVNGSMYWLAETKEAADASAPAKPMA